MKYTRQDYMDKKCTHREYYAQFVTNRIKSAVVSHVGKENILASKDPHMNDIRLATWDMLGDQFRTAVRSSLKEAGDFPTMAVMCCIMKEAARQIVEAETIKA